MHNYGRDFYGSNLKICVIGYLRPEMNFNSVEELIETIQKDIENAREKLDAPEALKLKDHDYFTEPL